MNIGAKIREARKAKKLTQKQFAQLIGKTGQIVSNWEREYTPNISFTDMLAIEKALEVSIVGPREYRDYINLGHLSQAQDVENFFLTTQVKFRGWDLLDSDKRDVLAFIEMLYRRNYKN